MEFVLFVYWVLNLTQPQILVLVLKELTRVRIIFAYLSSLIVPLTVLPAQVLLHVQYAMKDTKFLKLLEDVKQFVEMELLQEMKNVMMEVEQVVMDVLLFVYRNQDILVVVGLLSVPESKILYAVME